MAMSVSRIRSETSPLLLAGVSLLLWLMVKPSKVSRRLAQLRGTVLITPVDLISSAPPPEATISVPLHATSGTHHAYVYVGSPPQRQALIVDTGSRLMAFPCRPCRQCGRHTSSFFDPAISTTDVVPECGQCYLEDIATCSNRDNKCHLSQKYTEGSSWKATEMEDLVWFGSIDEEESYGSFLHMAIPYAFGCQVQETGLFTNQYADGILGLAMHETSLIKALDDAGSIPRNAFSMCLTTTGGHLSLGGSLKKQHQEPMQFSPLVNSGKSWFSLAVWEVRVGDVCVACRPESIQSWFLSSELTAFASGKGTIVDSGTTDTYLPQAIEASFKQAWKKVTKLSYEKRTRRYTYKEFTELPKVSFLFAGAGVSSSDIYNFGPMNDKSNGVSFALYPESYMEGVPLDDKGKPKPWSSTMELTNRIYLDETDGAVIGANGMSSS